MAHSIVGIDRRNLNGKALRKNGIDQSSLRIRTLVQGKDGKWNNGVKTDLTLTISILLKEEYRMENS